MRIGPGPGLTNSTGERRLRRAAVVLVIVHGLMLAWISVVNSPNLDELAHLPSGISHWHFGRFELYRVNPPLVRMVAALPVMLSGAETDWSDWNSSSPYSRTEFFVGKAFTKNNAEHVFWYYTLARWACIPLCLIGAWICFRWSQELYGTSAGLISTTLYCFCPHMLAWGSSITPDAAAASLGVWCGYAFWRWLRCPSWGAALHAGVALGLAELTKSTWIVLFGLWPAVWLVWSCVRRSRIGHQSSVQKSTTDAGSPAEPDPPHAHWRNQLQQLAAILLLAVYLINLGYGFEGSFQPLERLRFISQSLSGERMPPTGGNRFAGTFLGKLPVPFPEEYVRGIDVQRFDFEQGKWSYLRGTQQKGGWWYYYLYGLLVKTPLGTLTLVAACALTRRRSQSSKWLDELVVLFPAVIVLTIVSSQTGFNRYLRYVVPALPFLYVFVGRLGSGLWRKPSGVRQCLVLAAVLGAAVESFNVFPHSMSFFNVLAGGPHRGHEHLIDANIDWGQDLLFLKRWSDDHPQARPLHVAYFAGWDIDPNIAGIEWVPVPTLSADSAELDTNARHTLPGPGWFAVSINYVRGYHYFEHDKPIYAYFQEIEPVAKAGYSIYIYHTE